MRMIRSLLALFVLVALLLTLPSCDLLSFLGAPSLGDADFTPTVFTEVVKDNFENAYADQLSPNEKHIFDAVAALSPGELTVKLSFPEVPAICKGREPTDAEMDALGNKISAWTANALYAIWLDHPEIFWIDYSIYSYKYEVKSDATGVVMLSALSIDFSLPEGITDPVKDAAALAQATKDFSVKGATVAEKVAYINNYLCARISYDLDAPNRGNVIGALVGKKCVCEGYAQAFVYLAQKAGIPAVNIPGYGITEEGTEGHMWSAVRIDGALFAVDVTWNDTSGRNDYLLVGTQTVCGKEPFAQTHIPDMLTLDGPHKPFALPAVSSLSFAESPKTK